MNVLIACEFSGVMREAFRARGHRAYSCDLLPAADGSKRHFQMDVRDLLAGPKQWDLMIAHPPCTYLCNSGVRWLYQGGRGQVFDEDRWLAMIDGVQLFKTLLEAPIPLIAVENPVMHRHARVRIGRGPDQIVQPWWFGEEAFKATGFWLKGLKPLEATAKLTPPRPGSEKHKAWSSVHRASPSPDRWKERSITFPGIAAAAALQWGGK